MSNLTTTTTVSELRYGTELHDWSGPSGVFQTRTVALEHGGKELNLQRTAPVRAARILIVDHEPAVAPIFRQTLIDAGHRLESTEKIQGNEEPLGEYAPHCIILNLNSRDDKRPFHLIDEIRSWFRGPIMVVSDMCSESTKVSAFERGADEYVCVPFGLREFAARVDALLRRTSPSPDRHLRVGQLHIDRAARAAFLNGEALDLTHKEFDILVCLAQNPGVVMSAESLLSRVWGTGFVHYNQTLRVHISNLRKKARSASPVPDFIKSVPGNGYVLALETPPPIQNVMPSFSSAL